MKVKIDKGIAIPPPRSKYPWSEMKIGDSFFSDIQTMPVSASQAGKRYNHKYRVRKENKGFRVWRIK